MNIESSIGKTNLGSLCIQEPDYGVSATAIERTDENQPKYIRITDFSDNGIEDNHTFMTANDYADKHRLQAGDILFARSGSVGRTYLYDSSIGDAIFAGYCIRFRFDKAKVLPEYVYWHTKTDIFKQWVNNVQRPAVQANINKKEYKAHEIFLPTLDTQRRLVAFMNAAAQDRREKLREADALLAGMDEYVRKKIGLPTEINNRPMCFATTVSQKGRFDPEFYNPFYQHRVARIKAMKHDTLGNIIEFSSETWNQSSDFVDMFPYIEISGVGLKSNEYRIIQTPIAETPSRAKMVVRDQDIIVSTTRPHRGAIATIACDDGYYIASTGFCVLRELKRKDVIREYLQWVLLNEYVLQQFLQRSSGGNYPAIIQGEIKKALIPIPDESIQREIVAEAGSRKIAARALRAEAETAWAAAKTRFERELIAGGGK